MTSSQGRQYPDGPLEPAPGTDRPRLPDSLEGWPDNSLDFWPKAASEFLFGGESEPGPPYVHTLEGPIPPLPDYKPYRIEFEIGTIRPPGPRIAITADFCQCPACREARCEP